MMEFVLKFIILNPVVYAVVLFVTSVIYITGIISEKRPKNIIKAEYASSGMTKARIQNLLNLFNTLDLTDTQKTWIENVVIDEINNMIDLSIVSRKKSLRLLFIFRALPLLTSLLTALAAQVQEIQNAALFMVNLFTVIGSIANELNRLNKHYANWVFARATTNDLYSAASKFIAIDDHPKGFTAFVTEIDRIQMRYDHTLNDMLSGDLDISPQDKDKPKQPPIDIAKSARDGVMTTVATSLTGAVAGAVIANEVAKASIGGVDLQQITEVAPPPSPENREPEMPEGF
jgi:hypothetical protein